MTASDEFGECPECLRTLEKPEECVVCGWGTIGDCPECGEPLSEPDYCISCGWNEEDADEE